MIPAPLPTDPATAFLLVCPMPGWRKGGQTIASGIRLGRLTPPEQEAVASSNALLRHHNIDASAKDGYWLCYEFENPYPPDNVRYRRRQEAAFKLILHVMYSIQILLPIGAPNLFLLLRETDTGLTVDSTRHRPAFIGAVWARYCDVPESFGEDIPLILSRLRQVFQKPILRLQIPVWLLEQGLIASDRHIRILLWAIGLDGITSGGGVASFSERLCSLLGADAGIFPGDGNGRRPSYKVADVLQDLYLLRTEMAHGLPFHEKFRKKRAFFADEDRPVFGEFAGCRYDQILEECAAFLLCKALKEILLRKATFDVQAGSWLEQIEE